MAKSPAFGARKRRKSPAKSRAHAHKAKPPPAGTAPPVSPLAPRSFANLLPLAGVRMAAGAAGVRYRDRTDVLMVVMAPGTQVAGSFTRSKTAAAPVEWCKTHLPRGVARALVINSGNANAFTGKAGRDSVRQIAESTAAFLDCHAHEVFLASTGVIGEPLPTAKILRILGTLAESGAAGGWRGAAEAIMTTDTYPKMAMRRSQIDGVKVTINGIAKGSGMIAPDMSTMLAFIFTDANLPAPVLQDLLSASVKGSFNAITVDNDTSTSDTVLMFATGRGAHHPSIPKAADVRLADFRRKLDEVLLDLALQVVRDGEGARKLIRIDIGGAESDASARKIGMAVANSPLVKTAIGGGDANWGRVVMAVGKAGEPADRDRLKISFGGHVVAEKGMRAENYDERAITKAVAGREVAITIDLDLGLGKATVWTCDLTEEYVRINGSYRS